MCVTSLVGKKKKQDDRESYVVDEKEERDLRLGCSEMFRRREKTRLGWSGAGSGDPVRIWVDVGEDPGQTEGW